MASFEIPALDGSGRIISASVRQAIANAAEVQAAIDGKVAVMGNALLAEISRQHSAVVNLPTAAADRPLARILYRTSNGTLYVSNGSAWQAVGGDTDIATSLFCTLASGFSYDTASTSAYAVRGASFMDFRLRITKNSGAITHGMPIFSIAAAYLPWGSGPTPVAAITSGGSQTAALTGGTINTDGTVTALSPTTGATTFEVFGRYRIPV